MTDYYETLNSLFSELLDACAGLVAEESLMMARKIARADELIVAAECLLGAIDVARREFHRVPSAKVLKLAKEIQMTLVKLGEQGFIFSPEIQQFDFSA